MIFVQLMHFVCDQKSCLSTFVLSFAEMHQIGFLVVCLLSLKPQKNESSSDIEPLSSTIMD